MPNVTAKENQTIVDLSIQETGSIEGMFDIAVLNDRSVTDDLESGELVNADVIVNDDLVYDQYVKRGLNPASNTAELVSGLEEGIEFWAIEEDFIVS
jgi:hypothetical protein